MNSDLSQNSLVTSSISYYPSPVITKNQEQFFGRPLWNFEQLFDSIDNAEQSPRPIDQVLNSKINSFAGVSATSESGYLSPIVSPTCSLKYSSSSSNSTDSSFGPSTPIASSTIPMINQNSSGLLSPMDFPASLCEPLSSKSSQ